MSEKCVHEWYYRVVDICSWQFFCIRCGEKLSMDKFSDHASDLEKRMAELGKATARIAELEAEVTKGHELQDAYCDRIAKMEGLVDELIEAGERMSLAVECENQIEANAYYSWKELVKDWKEREG